MLIILLGRSKQSIYSFPRKNCKYDLGDLILFMNKRSNNNNNNNNMHREITAFL